MWMCRIHLIGKPAEGNKGGKGDDLNMVFRRMRLTASGEFMTRGASEGRLLCD